MRYVIEAGTHCSKFASANAIMNALSFYGAQVYVWQRDVKPFYDLIDETSPTAIFINNKLENKHIQYCIHKGVRIVDINSIEDYVPDVLTHNPSSKNPLFANTSICIAYHLDIEDSSHPEIVKRLGNNFRLFTPMKHHGSYGPIPKSVQGQALASCDAVFALSIEGLKDAILCNLNSILVRDKYDLQPPDKFRKLTIEECNLNIAEKYLPIGFDCSKGKLFLSQVFGE